MVHFLVHTPQVVISGKLNSSWEDKFLPLRFNFLTLVCNVFLYEGSFCSRWMNQTGIRAQRKQADYFFFLLFLLYLSKILFVKCTHKFKPTTLFSQICQLQPTFLFSYYRWQYMLNFTCGTYYLWEKETFYGL